MLQCTIRHFDIINNKSELHLNHHFDWFNRHTRRRRWHQEFGSDIFKLFDLNLLALILACSAVPKK